MPIRFKCPHCQKPLSVKEHLAGKRAPCPACKQVLRIPDLPAPARVVDVEAEAASAFADEPAQKPAVAEPTVQPITFECTWCGEEVQVPASEAGKQVPCPNADCRRIVKVPLPKAEKPKDWRTVEAKGPSLAASSQTEKLDGVMSSRDDKAKVSQKALVEAGVVKLPPKKGIGTRGWVRRGVWGTFLLGAFVGAAMVLVRLKRDNETSHAKDIMPSPEEIKAAKFSSDLPLAELHRGIGLIMADAARPGMAQKCLRELQTARGHIPRDVSDKTPTVDRDLFLIELALAQILLGGTEDQVRGKEKLDWKADVYKELGQTLQMIKAPEARVCAVREVGSRLLDNGQPELAIGLAGTMSGTTPAVKSQTIALAMAADKKKLLEELPKEPEPGQEIKDVVTRCGFVEGYVRKGQRDKAMELAQAKGPPRDQLEACVGAAAVLFLSGKPRDKETIDAARPFVDEALKRAKETADATQFKKAPPASPWVILQLIRMAARVGALPEETQKKLRDSLPAEFRRRADLELYLIQCETADQAVRAPNPEDFGKDDTTVALAVEAAARHNWQVGDQEELDTFCAGSDGARYRPMVKLGQALGRRFPRQ